MRHRRGWFETIWVFGWAVKWEGRPGGRVSSHTGIAFVTQAVSLLLIWGSYSQLQLIFIPRFPCWICWYQLFLKRTSLCVFPRLSNFRRSSVTLLCSVWFGLHLSSVGLQCLDHISADLSSLILGMSCIRAAPVSSVSPELSRDEDGRAVFKFLTQGLKLIHSCTTPPDINIIRYPSL